MDFDNLSNNELKIKIKSLNDEFEAVKSDVSKKVKYMEELSKNYDKCNEILNKRTNGRVI